MSQIETVSPSNEETPLTLDTPTILMLVNIAGVLIMLGLAGGLYYRPRAVAPALASIGLGLPLLWLAWRRAEFGLLAVVFLSASFIRPDIVDIRLPVGGLDLRDLAFLGMLGIGIGQRLQAKELSMPWWPVAAPLLAFLGVATFSSLYAVLYQRVEPNWAFGELRPLFYYTLFFVTAWTIREPRQIITLLIGLFVLADITAAMIILHQFLGVDHPALKAVTGSVWHVEKMGSGGFGTIRIVPPGHVLTLIMMVVAFCLMVYSKLSPRLRIVLAIQFLFLNAGLLLTYTRAQWIAAAIAFLLIALFMPRADKTQFVRYALGAVLVLVLIYSLFGGEIQSSTRNLAFLDSLKERAMSIFTPEETLQSWSLQWRVFETEEALRSIDEQPVLGVGLGNAYRDVTLLRGEARSGQLRFTRFVHNSYLYMAVKMGVIGLIGFAWFYLSLLGNGWFAYARRFDGYYRRIALALLTCLCGLLSWSITEPHFMQLQSTIVVGLVSGLLASMLRINQMQKLNSVGSAPQA